MIYAIKMHLIDVVTIQTSYPFRGKILPVQHAIQHTNSISCSSDSNLSANSLPPILAVQMKNVSLTYGIDWQSCISPQLTAKAKPNWLLATDILFIARGSNNHAILVDPIPEGVQAVSAQHFYLLRCRHEQVCPGFIAWWLNQPPCQQYFLREAEGSLHKSIRRPVLEKVPIVLPPLEEQQRISTLAHTLRSEQQLMQEIVANGEQIMHGIAQKLSQSLSPD